MFRSVNPSNGEIIREFTSHSESDVSKILDNATIAQKNWGDQSISERAAIIRNIGNVFQRRADEFAQIMTLEMGKPLAQSYSELNKCGSLFDYYAEHAEEHLSKIEIPTEAKSSYVVFDALGIVLAIMPWNFPFWQVCRFAIPALLAGNAVILKHAENTFGCAEAIESAYHEAGVPFDLFRSIRVPVHEVKGIIEDRRIAAVSLTGSTRAGKAVAAQAGAVIKPVVLELGGNDPYIILADADLDKAVNACVTSRLINAGQSCIAAKRFIVVEEVYNDFLEKLKATLAAKVVGNPMDEATDVGPMARFDLRDELHRQVQESINKGATCLMGGEPLEGDGAFYPITLLTEVQKGMPAYEEELFGPVAVVIKSKHEEEAIQIANDSFYGLGAAVFSENIEKAKEIARFKLKAGSCFVNDFVRSDPRLPFGGIKESGFGRELSVFGIREFVNVKTVYIS